MLKKISFLKGGLCHNNISISSVFVADDGTWKLGAMECACPFAEASSAFLLQCQSIRSEKVIAPEEKVIIQELCQFYFMKFTARLVLCDIINFCDDDYDYEGYAGDDYNDGYHDNDSDGIIVAQ